MAFDGKKNFSTSLVATVPSPAASGTSLVVTGGDGTKFPAVPFNATIWPINSQPTSANAEIVRVTNIATDTFTITRTQESTSARTVLLGDQIAATITAKALTDIETTLVPAGSLIMYGGAAAPTGWQLCDGSSLLRAGTFAALFAAIGTTFGSVDGTHFTVPDLRQRFPMGVATSGTGNALGATGGTIDHTHTSAAHTHTYTDIVNHTHTITDPTHAHNILTVNAGGGALNYIAISTTASTRILTTGFTDSVATGITGTNNPAGGVATGTTASTTPGVTGTANPPFLALNYIIKT